MHVLRLQIFVAVIITGYVLSLIKSEEKCMYIDFVGRRDVGEEEDIIKACNKAKICSKHFNISYIMLEPYYKKSPIEDIILQCCGRCSNFSMVSHIPDISHLSPSGIKTSHFIYPFLGKSSTKTLYGYYFIPTLEAPNIFYFTLKDEHAMVKLLNACLDMYPLIVICLLMALLSGFLAWIMETWFNREEFPRPFLTGWFEGFWWSFVSMTTVGYGDKTPKSFPARIFSVLWILIGIITFDILTATLTAEVTSATAESNPNMEGEVVGALKLRMYEAYIIAKHGGKYAPTMSEDFMDEVMELIDMLKEKDIAGFILDMYSVWYASNLMAQKAENNTEVKSYFNIFKNLRKIEKTNLGEKLSYGILVRDKEDYDYFHDVIVDNALVSETAVALDWNTLKKKIISGKTYYLTSASGPYFKQSLHVVGIILGIILTFGVIYELHRRKTKIRRFGFNKMVKVSIEGYGLE